VMEVLFGEAIEAYGADCTPVRLEGRRKMNGAGFLNVHEFAHEPGMADVISRFHSLTTLLLLTSTVLGSL
jgi:hypothetical protein